nr:MAG TPA: bacteriocin [Bacteriophage sp.]
MKILAVILIIISLSKLMCCISKDMSKTISRYVETNGFIDPDWLDTVVNAVLAGDGLVGLFCGLFILFMT